MIPALTKTLNITGSEFYSQILQIPSSHPPHPRACGLSVSRRLANSCFRRKCNCKEKYLFCWFGCLFFFSYSIWDCLWSCHILLNLSLSQARQSQSWQSLTTEISHAVKDFHHLFLHLLYSFSKRLTRTEHML